LKHVTADRETRQAENGMTGKGRVEAKEETDNNQRGLECELSD
jgi:hypothetical protein